jgi:hypothetical protein
MDGHYFWQDLIVARELFQNPSHRHLDIGSRGDGLISHLLVFMKVDVVDIRPLAVECEGLNFIQSDGTTLEGIPSDFYSTASSLHALEHFGLGRYGDELDPTGHEKGLRSLERIVQPGGRFWVSFPLGDPQVEFNSQRILSPEWPGKILKQSTLFRFTLIPSTGNPIYGIDLSMVTFEKGDCGLFEFVKRKVSG